jgi:hypothetical protein
MKLETDLARMKRLARAKEAENQDFRLHIKNCDIDEEEIDAIVRRLHAYVASEIDCRTCANCCREMAATLEQKDIVRLARAEGITPEQFEQRYLDKTDEPGRFVIREKPCPFLSGNLCRHHNIRPESCAEFPFLHKPDFSTRTIMVLWNLPVCPIVYNVYELLKDEVAELELIRRAAKEEDIE